MLMAQEKLGESTREGHQAEPPRHHPPMLEVAGDALVGDASASRPVAAAKSSPPDGTKQDNSASLNLYQAPLAKLSFKGATFWLPVCFGEGSWCSE